MMDKRQKQALAETYKYAKMMCVADASRLGYADIARALRQSDSFKNAPSSLIETLAESVVARFAEATSPDNERKFDQLMGAIQDSAPRLLQQYGIDPVAKAVEACIGYGQGTVAQVARYLKNQEQDRIDSEDWHERQRNRGHFGPKRVKEDSSPEIQVGDKIRTIKGGQVPGTVEKITDREVYFRHPEGKLYKTWIDNVRKDVDETVSGAVAEAAPATGGIGPSNAARLLHTLLVKKLSKVRSSEQLDALEQEAQQLYDIAGEESKFYHNYIWWNSGDLYDSVKKKIAHLRTKFGIDEVAAPGQEEWIRAHKADFIKQYGKDKGLSVLYATAWKRSKAKESLYEDDDAAYAAELDRLRGLLRAARKEWNDTGDRSYYDRAEKEYAKGYDVLVQKYPEAHRRQAAASQAAVYKEPAPKRYSSY